MEKIGSLSVPLSVREERIAQNMLFHPEESVDSLIAYEEELWHTPQYAAMAESVLKWPLVKLGGISG